MYLLSNCCKKMDNPSADTSSFESEIDRLGCIGNSRVTNENRSLTY